MTDRLLIALLLMSSITFAINPKIPDAKPKVAPPWLKKAKIEFGSIDDFDRVFETSEITYKVGNRYGWSLHLQEVPGKIEVKEVFTLPGKATWKLEDGGGEALIEAEGSQSVTKRVVPADLEGESRGIANGWAIAEGDPEGKYRMDIFLNDHFFKRIEFVVGDLERDPRFRAWEKQGKARWAKMWKAATTKDLARWFQEIEKAATEWETQHRVSQGKPGAVGGPKVYRTDVRHFVLGEMRKRQLLKRGMTRDAVKEILGKPDGARDVERKNELEYGMGPVSMLNVHFDDGGKVERFHYWSEGEASGHDEKW